MKFMKYIHTFILVTLLCISIPSYAENFKIVATIGNEAITNNDLINRMKILIISSGIESTPENLKKIQPQAIQSLINDKLQIAEAQNLGLEISEEDIDNAYASLEKQNKLPEGGLTKLLQMNQIPPSTMREQLRAELSWLKIKGGKIRSRVSIGEEEIDDYINASNINTTREEYLMYEIVLPVDMTAEEQAIKELAEKLKSEIENGKDFAAIAKQFSESPTAASGGEVGWLNTNQVPSEILGAMKKLKKGELSEPIRSIEGYFLVKYADYREISNNNDKNLVTMRQFLIPVAPDADNKQVTAAYKKAETIDNNTRACMDSANYANDNKMLLKDYGTVRIGDLSPDLKNIINILRTGIISSPVKNSDGLSLFIVCEKIEEIANAHDENERESAKKFLFIRKLELEARKYLRDLRRKTNIDVRV
ncbi:MAG: hypothetical protein COV36_07690 [Alphaproteobacteria bacterium CG11_big_fil_rev_8_21_14_0_20_44_7]|nr:MAG: hypothetical protein COV36_07690 [Alphaproteobacteria bacterium CG11_big_fil_rev_8_21_14_0_20_44_7]